MFNIGDLVRMKKVYSSTPIFSTWGNKEGGDKPIGTIQPGEIGVILETTEPQGGNGTRILVSGVKIGWVNIIFLENET
jgi:hypothetical protein